MQLIRISSDSCSNCLIMKEMMRRIMPEFPQIEIIDLDIDLDKEEAKQINPQGAIPFLKIGNHTKTGSCKMDELRQFFKEALENEKQ